MSVILPPPPRRPSSPFINGATRLFGIVGHPIVQGKSPEIITPALQARGLNAVLVPLDISPDDFPSVFPGLLRLGNLDGLIVTVPHKKAALSYMDRLGPRAEAAGAASVLARSSDGLWVGDLLDGCGCRASIENRGVKIKGSTVQLLGAGGAGGAIALELLAAGPAMLRIHDPDLIQLKTLLERIEPHAGPTAIQQGLGPADILVNASPVGMNAPDESPVPDSYIMRGLVVMDCVMEPDPTRLLRTAARQGAHTISGREMFDSQVDSAVEFFVHANSSTAQRISFR